MGWIVFEFWGVFLRCLSDPKNGIFICFFLSWLLVLQCNQALWLICRGFLVENAYIFNTPHRLIPCIGEAGFVVLLPIPTIAEVFEIAINQLCCERLRRKKHNSTVFFYDPVVLLPKGFKWNDRVPFASRGAVWKIT